MSKPNEIYRVDMKEDKVTELTFENKEILDQVKMGKVEERWIETTDGKKMLTWIIYPPNFDPSKSIQHCFIVKEVLKVLLANFGRIGGTLKSWQQMTIL